VSNIVECNDDPKLTEEELEAIDVLAKLSPADRAAVEQLAVAQRAKESN